MATKELGRLERVDVRECWTHEQLDFTPWLSRPENVALLGDALGLDLQFDKSEVQVGPFRADLLCREREEDRCVLVENQLEGTDHSHLGQVLTYAAGLEAACVVWISTDFRPEHRAALDWLNNMTVAGLDFFGLQLEAWRIGTSAPAPRFTVVSKPNDWKKEVRSASATVSGESNQKLLDHWAGFVQYLAGKSTPFPIPKACSRTFLWVDMGLPDLQATISRSYNFHKSVICVKCLTPAAFSRLHDGAAVLVERVGQEIQWSPETSRLQLWSKGDASVTDDVTTHYAWLTRTLSALATALKEVMLDAGEANG